MKAIKEYLASPEVASLAKSTKDNYSYALQHLASFCAEQGITKPSGFQEKMPPFADYLAKKEISAASIQAYIRATKIFLRWAQHPVEYTYRSSHEDRKAAKKKRMERWFSEEDIEKCLSYQFSTLPSYPEKLRGQVLVRLFVETGARLREIASITPEVVDLKHGILMFQDSKTEPRPGFFSEDIVCRIEDLLRIVPNGKPMFGSPEEIRRTINNMLIDLGLKNGSDGRGPHTFRHYTATYLYYVGCMDLVDIATYLGDKPETIRETYLHPTPLMLRKRVAKAMGWQR